MPFASTDLSGQQGLPSALSMPRSSTSQAQALAGEVALRERCSACRLMAAYVFCAHSTQHNGTHALIVLSSALHCGSDAM